MSPDQLGSEDVHDPNVHFLPLDGESDTQQNNALRSNERTKLITPAFPTVFGLTVALIVVLVCAVSWCYILLKNLT